MQDNLTVPFNPEESARFVRGRIESVNRMTVEAVAELCRARDHYSGKGNNQYSSVPSGTKLVSFEAYLEAAGLPRRTAYNWLERYIAEENKLLTYEEFTDKKESEKLARLSKEDQQRAIIAEYRKTSVKPAGWTPEIERDVKRTDEHLAKIKADREKEESERQQRAKEYREKQEAAIRPQAASIPKAAPPDDVDHYYRLGKAFEEGLKTASNTLKTKHTERIQWKEKIRLSDGGQSDAFNDALIDYMESLPDDNRRIEACNNIIKICRNLAVELQRAA